LAVGCPGAILAQSIATTVLAGFLPHIPQASPSFQTDSEQECKTALFAIETVRVPILTVRIPILTVRVPILTVRVPILTVR
jgi:hypothetical protein